MKKNRKYGEMPYSAVLVHGGPGAVGDMKPVAEKLSDLGVIETLHRAKTVEGQVRELRDAVEETQTPAVLIGHSWGAWLVFIFAAEYPSLVEKSILVSSGPFEEKYVPSMKETLLQRMTEKQEKRYYELRELIAEDDDERWLNEYGKLVSKLSAYDMVNGDEEVDVLPEVNESVWNEASKMRRSGELLELGRKITSPVLAIHGDHDHHPYQGVKEPLSRVLDDFRFILLEKCGHYPWKEREAKERFFQLLRDEIS